MSSGCRWAHLLLAAALAVAAVSMLSACSAQQPRPPAPSGAPSGSDEQTPTGEPVALADLKLTLEPLWKDLDRPVYLTHAGDGTGRLYIVEQGGIIKVIHRGKIVADKPFLDVRDRISDGGERGLLGLAFSPDYESTGVFYVNYTDRAGDTNVVRFTAADPSMLFPKLDAGEVVLKVKQPYPNHNGGCLQFGPDGMLYVGMGDGGSGGDPGDRAQDDGELLGKLLRLDVAAGGKPKPEVVEKGLRNPWRFSFDRETGDLWIGDVGQGLWEEIDFAAAGSIDGVNWGWNRWEGDHAYPEGARRSRDGFTFPIAEYGHDKGESVTGGYIYRGKDYPALMGTYLYADFGSGFIAGIRRTAPDGSPLPEPEVRTLVERSGTMPSSFGEDEAGELYLVDYNGTIWAVDASAK